MWKWVERTLLLGSVLLPMGCFGQPGWQWSPGTDMPMPTANHAVCAAQVNGSWYTYSFGGITTGLVRDSIHRKAFRYDVQNDQWSALPDLPDTLGKIASAASVVDGVAYVIGGYHVLAGAPFEVSSDRVHRLDLATDQWLSDGAPVPVPIDDHVQAVWRDSLIYVITGWSNTTNVPAVQVYDPAFDVWSSASPVPNTNQYKAFGASGAILGDTIYYYGGASSGINFPAQSLLRIGVIDPLDPTQIDWLPVVSGAHPLYRSACIAYDGRAYWLGGSAVSYNFDALAYAGGAVVPPLAEVTVYDPVHQWQGTYAIPHALMDLRGAGVLDNGSMVLCGGIGAGRTVLSGTWVVQAVPLSVPEIDRTSPAFVYPVPSRDQLTVVLPRNMPEARARVLDAVGRELEMFFVKGPSAGFSMEKFGPGTYFLELSSPTAVTMVRFWLVN